MRKIETDIVTLLHLFCAVVTDFYQFTPGTVSSDGLAEQMTRLACWFIPYLKEVASEITNQIGDTLSNSRVVEQLYSILEISNILHYIALIQSFLILFQGAVSQLAFPFRLHHCLRRHDSRPHRIIHSLYRSPRIHQ